MSCVQSKLLARLDARTGLTCRSDKEGPYPGLTPSSEQLTLRAAHCQEVTGDWDRAATRLVLWGGCIASGEACRL